MNATSRSGFFCAVPGGPMRPYAKSYGSYCGSEGQARRWIPMSCVTVALTFDPWSVAANKQPLSTGRAPFVRGLSQTVAVARQDDDAHSIWLDLTPLGAAALFGVPCAELRDRIVPLDALLGREADALTAHLIEQPTCSQRLDALDAWLRERIASAPKLRPDVVWAWQTLTASGGEASINTLIDQLGCSRRHLAQRFSETVGMTPKAYGRLIRCERAIANLLTGDEDLSAIALDCGYYDQAHLNRDVRAFSGMSPTKLLAERIAVSADFRRSNPSRGQAGAVAFA